LWWGLAAVTIVAGAGLYLNRDRVAPKEGGGSTGTTVRTAAIAAGDLNRTLRVTGTITAERFAAVIAPQLRGSRGSFSGSRGSSRGSMSGVFGGGGGGGGGSSSNSPSSSGGGSSSGSSSQSAATMTITSSNSANSTSQSDGSASPASGGRTASSSLGASRGSGNRFSDRAPASSASRNSSKKASAGSNSSSGSNILGSTAGGLFSSSMRGSGGPGGGGSMGRDGDFMLVLLELPNAGGRVKKGDVVAEFDRQYMLNRIDDYKDSVVQAEANIKNKKATLAVAREAHNQQLRVAKADVEKAKLDMQTLEVVSAIDAEKLKLAVEETQARYEQLLKEVPLLETSQTADLRNSEITRDTSKIELQKSVTNAEKMILKAPMDGLVVMQSVRRGMEFGQAQKGDQISSGQMFMQIVDPTSMVVNANVNQVDAELLRIGQKATVRIDAYPGMELPAHVYSIGAVPVAGRRPNFMRQIPIRLKLDKVDPLVVPDLSASADVVLESERQATLAPLASIFQDGPAGKPYVFLRSETGWQKHPVELGLQNNVEAVVKSGLSLGDVVALDSPMDASPDKPERKPPA